MNALHLQWHRMPASALHANADLRQQWDALNDAQGRLPFLASHAIVSALQCLGSGKECLLIGAMTEHEVSDEIVEEADADAALAHPCRAVVAMLVLTPQRWLRWQTFQPSQLPLGAWVCAPQLPVLALARSLMRGPLGACLALSLTPLDPLLTRRPADEADSDTRDYIDTAWVETQPDFAQYWQARGKNLRHNLRKQRQRLQTEGVSVTVQTLRQPEEMAAAVTRYGALESQGWKAQLGTAIHDHNAQGRFYRALLAGASQQQEAVVFQLLFDERVVAMNLGLQRADTLVVLKTTYDENLSQYSPAVLLQEAVLRDYHDTQATGHRRRLEFFGRVMDWHSKWTQQQRTLYHLTVYRWPWLKQLALARQHRAANRAAKLDAEAAPQLLTKDGATACVQP